MSLTKAENMQISLKGGLNYSVLRSKVDNIINEERTTYAKYVLRIMQRMIFKE